MDSKTCDLVIVGAGIVGLTVARELVCRQPAAKIAVLEKEAALSKHASGRNSGVLHAGIYYDSGSLKAKVCSLGSQAMQDYAAERGIPVQKTGKVIVATMPETASQIDVLQKRAESNGVQVERLDAQGLKEIEPHARSCGDALYSPNTAVIDCKAVLQELARDLNASGVELFLGAEVGRINAGQKSVETRVGRFCYGHLINCAGAYADRIAHLFGVARQYSIIPFRGSYFKLSKLKNEWVRGNIYPAPDLRYPFLGVHLTRGVNGGVSVGPTAMPALGREHYHGLEGIVLSELPSIFCRLAKIYHLNQNNFRALVHSEISKYSKKGFLQEVQLMVPGLDKQDLEPCDKSGIRPQLVDTNSWKLIMDFVIESGPNSTHVLNAISPAFTASFEFAKLVADKVEQKIPVIA